MECIDLGQMPNNISSWQHCHNAIEKRLYYCWRLRWQRFLTFAAMHPFRGRNRWFDEKFAIIELGRLRSITDGNGNSHSINVLKPSYAGLSNRFDGKGFDGKLRL